MMRNEKLVRVPGVSQLYVMKDTGNEKHMVFAKVTDDILIAGSVESMDDFVNKISIQFTLRKVIFDENITFNGCNSRKHKVGFVIMDMNIYLASLKFLPLSKGRRMCHKSSATKEKRNAFAKLTCKLIWVGKVTLPQASFVASIMQRKLLSLAVKGIIQTNSFYEH